MTQNVSEKGVNGILDRLSASEDKELMHEVYAKTLEAFSREGEASNERLWFKCSLKLCQLLLDTGALPLFNETIAKLVEATSEVKGGEEGQSGVHLMEIYSLQIQMFSRTKDVKKLKVSWKGGEEGKKEGAVSTMV